MNLLDKLKIKPKLSAVFRKEKVQAVYLVFREGMKAKETLRFQNRITNDQLLIDCGQDGYPIAVHFLLANGMGAEAKQPLLSKRELDSAIQALFLFATEMIRYHEARMQKRGNDLVKDATRVLKTVPPEKMKRLKPQRQELAA